MTTRAYLLCIAALVLIFLLTQGDIPIPAIDGEDSFRLGWNAAKDGVDLDKYTGGYKAATEVME